jgi:hypothetical protein
MTSSLFIVFVIVMLVAVVTAIARYSRFLPARATVAALLTWLVYVGAISYFGLVRNTTIRPPGAVYLFAPLVIGVALLVRRIRSSKSDALVSSLPLWLLLGTQLFRVPVELFLHELWHEGLIPKMLTFEGANVDIYVGASAPVIAWLATRGRIGLRIAQLWNIAGLAALANVVTRAILTAPGPLNVIHAEVPDLMIGTFPYTFVPGLFVPLAVLLHVLALRATTKALKQ